MQNHQFDYVWTQNIGISFYYVAVAGHCSTVTLSKCSRFVIQELQSIVFSPFCDSGSYDESYLLFISCISAKDFIEVFQI